MATSRLRLLAAGLSTLVAACAGEGERIDPSLGTITFDVEYADSLFAKGWYGEAFWEYNDVLLTLDLLIMRERDRGFDRDFLRVLEGTARVVSVKVDLAEFGAGMEEAGLIFYALRE